MTSAAPRPLASNPISAPHAAILRPWHRLSRHYPGTRVGSHAYRPYRCCCSGVFRSSATSTMTLRSGTNNTRTVRPEGGLGVKDPDLTGHFDEGVATTQRMYIWTPMPGKGLQYQPITIVMDYSSLMYRSRTRVPRNSAAATAALRSSSHVFASRNMMRRQKTTATAVKTKIIIVPLASCCRKIAVSDAFFALHHHRRAEARAPIGILEHSSSLYFGLGAWRGGLHGRYPL